MTIFHTHVMKICFTDDSIPEFETDEDLQAYQQMLGRYVYRAIRNQTAQHRDTPNVAVQPEDVGLTALGMIEPDEVVALYYGATKGESCDNDGALHRRGGTSEQVESTTKVLVERLVDANGRPFTLGAVKRDDGSWTFHS